MTITRTIIALTLLLTICLPHSAIAGEYVSKRQAELNALIVTAEKEIAATTAWQNGRVAERQKLTELAVRRKIITSAQSGYDKNQLEVDRKIGELLDTSLDKTSDLLVKPAQKERIRELFKEEMYRYFAEYPGSELEGSITAVRGSGAQIGFLMSQNLRGNKILEKELGDILENVNTRMDGVLRQQAIISLTIATWSEFNRLK
jgi:hypothetical protein